MHRFFIAPQQTGSSTILLSGKEAHHLRSVLRLQCGASIELFDGTGTVYQAQIEREEADGILLKITAQGKEKPVSPFPLTLAQAILKGKKMDLVCQKATELGVDTLIPIHTQFCQPQKNLERKGERWQRIVLESCKQCGRSTPMRIRQPVSFKDLDTSSYRYRIFCWEKETEKRILPETFRVPGKILLVIGPEGGFEQQELSWAREQGFQSVTLAPHVLRAETAAITASGIIGYLTMLQTPSGQE